MHPILFQSHYFILYTHALCFTVGALTAVLLWRRFAAQQGLNADRVYDFGLLIFLVALLAGRIGFFLIYPSQFNSLSQVLQIWQGGLVSYFALAGGLLMAFSLFPKEQRWQWFDLLVLVGLVGWGIGRLGNYFAGDSVGVLSPLWRLTYGRVPIQLFESLLVLVIALLLRVYYLKKLKKPTPGRVTYLALLGYAFGRLLIDTWRDETQFGPFHLSQWVALVIIAILLYARPRS